MKLNKECFIGMVSRFRKVFGQPLPATPGLPPENERALCASLLKEEVNELESALCGGDFIEAADALCDIQYVLTGVVLALGLGGCFDELLAEVHRSNMSKVCHDIESANKECALFLEKGIGATIKEENGKFIIFRDSDGKLMKPSTFSPPDIKGVLVRHSASQTKKY